MIRVLQILTYIKSGGAERVVYNYYNHIDRNKIHFDIVALNDEKEQFLASKFRSLGSNVFYISHNPLKRIQEINSIIKNGHYNIVHSHCEFLSELYICIAKYHGVKVRIIHSHIANSKISIIKKIYRPIGKIVAKKNATSFFACGIKAAISCWGKKYYDKGKCYIMNNAIDLKQFLYNDECRKKIRELMGWENKTVLVNVGRFNFQKNHIYLLNLFAEYIKKDSNSVLVLIGDGELKEQIKKQSIKLSIEDKLEMLGNRNDVSQLLNACDCFLLPSLFEGLPVVAIESQANGLPIIMADTITKECKISNIATYLPLSPVGDWIEAIHNLTNTPQNREIYNKIIAEADYDIETEASKLLKKYQELLYS